MKRTLDPCQTGWDSIDQPDIGLLSIYQSISQNSQVNPFSYRPHYLPLKTLPAQLEQQKQLQIKEQRQKEQRFAFNRNYFKDRIKRYLINHQKEKRSCRSSSEKDRKGEISEFQRPIKLKQFEFMRRETSVYHSTGPNTQKNNIETHESESRNPTKRLCIKEELEKIVKNRRKQTKQKNELRQIEKSSKKKHQNRENKPLLHINRYSTLDPHSQLSESKESLKSDKERKQMYLDCTIVNLSDQNQSIISELPKKRYSPYNNYSYRQKKRYSQMKRYQPQSFRQKKNVREIYRSNLLRECQDISPKTNYCQFKTLTPQKNITKLKEVIRNHLYRKINVKSQSRYLNQANLQ